MVGPRFLGEVQLELAGLVSQADIQRFDPCGLVLRHPALQAVECDRAWFDGEDFTRGAHTAGSECGEVAYVRADIEKAHARL